MKKILVFFLALSLSLFAVACSGVAGKLEKTEYEVELGSTFNLPKLDAEYKVTVTDANGKEVRTQFGSFRPALGEYTAQYDVDGKKQSIKIKCVDTTAPVVTFSATSPNANVGDVLTLPEFAASDLSGIKSTETTVTRSDGSTVTLDGENKWVAANDIYTVKTVATDNCGNKGEGAVVITARERFVDENKADGVLFDFDEHEYINLVYEVENVENFAVSLVGEGYPAIANEKAGNGVLKLSSDFNYGDVSVKISTYEEFAVRRADKIKIGICADRDVDYVKLLSSDGDLMSAEYMLKGGVWTDIEVDPINYGYGKNLESFILVARADRGLNLYIDEIGYSERFVPSLEEGVLARFDDERYVGRMYQNIYNGQPWVAGGSTFEIAENGGVKAMRVTTTIDRGGFTYMFDEKLDLSLVESITIRMNCRKSPRHLWIGTMQGTFKGGSSYNSIAGWSTNWSHLYVGEMHDYVITPEDLWNSCCVDGYMTGFWISVIDGNENGNVIDIESVTVTYKN